MGEVISSSIFLKAVLLVPWIFLLYIFGPYINMYIGIRSILPYVLIGLVTAQMRNLSMRILAGQMKIGQTAILRVFEKLAWISSGLALANLDYGGTAIIIGFIIGDITIVSGALIRMDIEFGKLSLQRMKSLATFGKYLFIGSVSGYMYSWIDVAILRFFVPPSLIGAYEVAWRIASLSLLLTQAIRESLFPQISDWYETDKTDLIQDAIYKWTQPPLYITLPALAGAAVLGKDILSTFF
ncbi:putative polysaccharide biosynthesis protein [Haloarcula marismortui ATCC 33799]|uniref:Putative polysaccharide biosynthesis protein n=2 Tax=Haloarcula marismortui TaxID=2238 RepID=M0JY90_9EURY|nr:putative polysaccharide biosynthesis protein [Haloarcula californiae ATCC 33799]